jgi:hypothetical protein
LQRFPENRSWEQAEECGEGSSGSKADKMGKKWFLKNGYGEDEDEDDDDGDDEDDEGLSVYEEPYLD